LVKIRAKIVQHGRSIAFQMAESWCRVRWSSRSSWRPPRCGARRRAEVAAGRVKGGLGSGREGCFRVGAGTASQGLKAAFCGEGWRRRHM